MKPEAGSASEFQSLREGAFAALKWAARMAREEALKHNTDLIIWRDGRLYRMSPDEIRKELASLTTDKGTE